MRDRVSFLGEWEVKEWHLFEEISCPGLGSSEGQSGEFRAYKKRLGDQQPLSELMENQLWAIVDVGLGKREVSD